MKILRIALVTMLVVTVGWAVQPAAQAAIGGLRLEASGSDLVRVSDGQKITLRGNNVVNYNWKYKYNRWDFQDDLSFLTALYTDWKANTATIWITSGPVLRNEAAYLEYLDSAVDIAVANDAYLILSWVSDEPDVGTHPFLISNDGIQAHSQLAGRYRDVHNVIHTTQSEPGKYTNDINDWFQLRNRQEETIDAIRQGKPEALVLVSGTEWSQRVDWMINYPVRRDNIAVQPHIYQSNFNYGGALTVAADGRWPVVVGEFGDSDASALMNWFTDNASGFQAWNMNNEGCPCQLNSKNANDRNSYGNVVRNFLINFVEEPPPPPAGPITGLADKCVDVNGANSANGTQVQLYTCNGTAAQQWTVGSDGTIRALGKCLDVESGVNADGTRVQIWDCWIGNTNQQWTYDSSTRELVNPATGRCLDVTGANSADRTPLQIWSCHGGTNQKWTLPT